MELKEMMGIWGGVGMTHEARTQTLKEACFAMCDWWPACMSHLQGLPTFTNCKEQVSVPLSWIFCLLFS